MHKREIMICYRERIGLNYSFCGLVTLANTLFLKQKQKSEILPSQLFSVSARYGTNFYVLFKDANTCTIKPVCEVPTKRTNVSDIEIHICSMH